MGNESEVIETIIHVPAYLFIKHNPRNNRKTKRKSR